MFSLWIMQSERAKFCLPVMNELKSRGTRNVLIAVVDDLKGFPDTIHAEFPENVAQGLNRISDPLLDIVRVAEGAHRARGCSQANLPRQPLEGVRGRTPDVRCWGLTTEAPEHRDKLPTQLDGGHPVLRVLGRSPSDRVHDECD